MENSDLFLSKTFSIHEVLIYAPNSVVIKTIMEKTTGSVLAYAFDAGESLKGKYSPFDTFIQVVEGKAEVLIEGTCTVTACGESIIIPGHSRYAIKARERFKMLATTIKSGYE